MYPFDGASHRADGGLHVLLDSLGLSSGYVDEPQAQLLARGALIAHPRLVLCQDPNASVSLTQGYCQALFCMLT